jgi:hypothetical protein
VDDNLIVGDKAAAEKTIKQIKEIFAVKSVDNVEEHIGCAIERDLENGSIKLSQPDLIKKLEATFGEDAKGLQEHKAPSAPGEVVMRPQDKSETISEEDQKTCRSGVGVLLCLVKHSRPDVSNSVRELAKALDGATEAHVKSSLRAVKFALDARNKPLVMKPTEWNLIWQLIAHCDSDRSGDRDARLSVAGFVVCLLGAPVAWKSRAQRSVSLSSTEAECRAISEACAEIMHIKQVLEFLGQKVKLPVVAHVGNVGAICLANNAAATGRMKHVDVRHHHVRERVEDGVAKIVFVKSKGNRSDICTKNTSQGVCEEHAREHLKEGNDPGENTV